MTGLTTMEEAVANVPPEQRRCAVLGSPIAHSLSPALHRAAYAELGLDWRYDAFEVDEAALEPFLAGLDRTWRGLSLTMPLKRAAIPLCASIDELAVAVDAVNTMVIDADGNRHGTNTDVPGMVAAFAERGLRAAGSAILLGVGATAGSTVAALSRLGVGEVHAFARDPARAETLVQVASRFRVSVEVARWDALATAAKADIAVSTVPAAASGPVADLVAERVETVFDAVYDPWPTPLAEAGRAAGLLVVGGLDLLVHQAVLQVELMTGRQPAPLAAMRTAGENALAASGADAS